LALVLRAGRRGRELAEGRALPTTSDKAPAAPLGLWDAVSIIIGIVVGSGIYETPPLVLKNVPGPAVALAVWAACGLLSLVGALCYAELGSTYPRTGGDYVYLGRAFGPWLGFLFGWAQLAVILTGSIGMLAFVFGDYAVRLWGLPAERAAAFAAGAVAALSLLNLLGVVVGKGTQNLLTALKVLGLGGILVAGFFWPAPATTAAAAAPAALKALPFAMVLVFLTYGGWNDAAYVAAEVRDGGRNIPRALIFGVVGVAVIYVLVNAAYLSGLGFAGAQQSRAVAADVLARPLGDWGVKAMCLLVMVSALGSVNGLIFSGSRVYSTLGADHPLFSWLGRWSHRRGAPVGALLAQAIITLAMIAVVGTPWGQSAVNALLGHAGLAAVEWEGHGGFETLLRCTAPVFWTFFLLTGLSLFVLRWRDRGRPRPFSVPLFPLLPLIFCATCGYMLWSAADYAGKLGLVGALLLVVGLPLYALSRALGGPGALGPVEPAGDLGPAGPGGPREDFYSPDRRVQP
jgi:amino acid transporter